MNKLSRYIPDPILYSLRRIRFIIIQNRKYRKFVNLRTGYSEDGYTLKPFDNYQCIFIHVPKCAGQSIRNTLFEDLLPGHINVYTYQQIFPKKEFDQYFKFSFVRNPWDRLVSAFLFMKSGGAHKKDQDWAEKHLVGFKDFESFIRFGLEKEEILSWPHFRPQLWYLTDQFGRLGVDFIGRVENINEDIRFIQNKLGVKKDLLYINKTETKKDDYRSYYTPNTREITARIYHQDIDTFDYDF
jgi:hypothetical protein